MGEKDKEMKKLMFTAALAAALVAAADGIESNNTVGYQEKEIGSFNLTLTTFAAIGADSVLGDIKPNAAFVNGGTIQTFTSAGKAGPDYIWVNDPEMLEAFEADEGWYLLEDDELTSCKNSEQLPFTTGFVAKSPAAGSKLIYAGEVKSTVTQIPVGGFTLSGNCSPNDITLASITPNAAFINGGTIQPFTSSGKAGSVYIWVNDPEMLEAFEATEGWYLLEDDELTTNQGAVPVSAGEAFVAKAVGAGSTISIPSAINQ